MNDFDALLAQARGQQPTQAPANAPQDPFAQLNLPTPIADQLEVPQESTFFERMGNSWDKRVTSVVDTVAGLTGLEEEQQEMLAGPLTEEQKDNLNPGWMAPIQIAGDAAGLVWDGAGEVVATSAVEGFKLLPDNVQEGTKQQFTAIMESPTGQAALRALDAGTEAWQAFATQYPQEAKTIGAVLNILPAGKLGKLRVPTELTPLKLNKVGNRKVLSPPKGRDKDIYNLITPEDSKKAQLNALEQGRVSESTLGGGKIVPSPEEWKVVDALSKLPINSAKTHTTNADIIHQEIVRLSNELLSKTRKTKGGVDEGVVAQRIQNNLNVARKNNPAIFGSNKPKGVATQEDLVAQFNKYLDENGNSWEGLLRSRQQFDDYLDFHLKSGTWSGRKASVATEAHKAIREAANSLLKEGVDGSAPLLDNMHQLYKGWTPILEKASGDAQGAIGRILQAINIHMPSTPAAQAYNLTNRLGWLGMAGHLAVSPFVATYKYGVKPITKSKRVQQAVGTTQYTLRDIVREGQKAAKLMKDPQNKKALLADLKTLTILAHSFEQGEYPEDVNEQRPR